MLTQLFFLCMDVNVKKPIKLKNRTKYFDASKDKVKVTFSSPHSYQSRRIKIEGYENRLYWQYNYCEDHDGQTFFYTLTYSEANMPKHYGFNCFDYEDLRELFTGGFRKILLRRYGTIFKYFVGAELGDGKGKRGLHNNPHYHVLFFLEPDRNPKHNFPYKKIGPRAFRNLVRNYWQGFDQDIQGFKDFTKECRFGIAKEGENLGKVTDFRACMYCAKYVCKDVGLIQNEDKVRSIVGECLRKTLEKDNDFALAFMREKVFPLYNIPLNAEGSIWKYSPSELLVRLMPNYKDSFEGWLSDIDGFQNDWYRYVRKLCNKFHLWREYKEFLQERVLLGIDDAITEYRNRFCNKCRISHGVGDYALQFIDDKMNPSILVPSKNGFKNRPISQYYYRKLYTDVVKPIKPGFRLGNRETESPIRILNELGIKYRLNKLYQSISKKSEQAVNNLRIVLSDEHLFNLMKDSDVNIDVWFDFSTLTRRVNDICCDNNFKDLGYRYAVYKLVYEDRFFPFDGDADCNVDKFPIIDVVGDYQRFLVPSLCSVSRSDVRLDSFLDSGCEGYLSYSQHPYFLRYLGLFAVLDLCADYFFVQGDDKAQREAEEVQAVKRFHVKRSLGDYFSNLNILLYA